MNRKKLAKVIKKLFRKLDKSVISVKEGFDKDAIHDFRLEVKRLRAFLRMVSFKGKLAARKVLPPELKKIYRAAGRIRDRQLFLELQQNTIREGNYPAALENRLLVEMDDARQEIMETCKKGTVEKARRKTAARLPGKKSRKSIDRFVDRKWETVTELLAVPVHQDAMLHEIRKNLKDIIYLDGCLCQSPGKWFQYEIPGKEFLEQARQLAVKLGAFNDVCHAAFFLQHGYLEDLSLSERERLKRFSACITFEKVMMKAVLACELGKTSFRKSEMT